MALSRNEIITRLRDILLSADERKRDITENCTEDSRLTADLGFSSVSMLYMVIAIEEDMGIRFGDIGTNDFETLGDVVDYIEERQK